AKIVLDEVSLVRRLIDARLPGLSRHRLVLDRDAPDGHARLPVALDELRVIEGPRAVKLRAQMAAVQHGGVVLHVCRRAAWTGEQLEPVPGRRQGSLDP